MSNPVRPHRRQPTRLPRPWDSPGKNTGVGCHFFLQCMKVKSEVAQSCPTLRDLMDCSLPGSSVHGIFQARVLEWGAIAFSRSLYTRFLITLRGICHYPHFTGGEFEAKREKLTYPDHRPSKWWNWDYNQDNLGSSKVLACNHSCLGANLAFWVR